MPHRITLIHPVLAYFAEGIAFLIGAALALSDMILGLIDPAIWKELTGAHGALFGAVVIVLALWTSKIADSKRMDKRHDELMALQTANAEKLMGLTAEAIKAHGLAISAINSMDRTIQNLTIEISDRPCQLPPSKKQHHPQT
jgi:hypothetical protein